MLGYNIKALMFSLYLLDNISGNGFREGSLVIISALSIIFGILVIISKNPIRSILFLIGLFITIAIYLFALNISFIALSYLLVYVGAVSILFLFILMLINVRISELTTDNNNGIPLSIVIIAIFSFVFSKKSFFSTSDNNLALLFNTTNSKEKNMIGEEINYNLYYLKNTEGDISSVFSCTWDGILSEMSHITSLGNILYTSHSMGIILIGLILLLAMIGAISVTAKSDK